MARPSGARPADPTLMASARVLPSATGCASESRLAVPGCTEQGHGWTGPLAAQGPQPLSRDDPRRRRPCCMRLGLGLNAGQQRSRRGVIGHAGRLARKFKSSHPMGAGLGCPIVSASEPESAAVQAGRREGQLRPARRFARERAQADPPASTRPSITMHGCSVKIAAADKGEAAPAFCPCAPVESVLVA